MMTARASGAFLGLSCGLAPGPLLALMLAQTLRHGPREGCKIALAPLIIDAPIILVTLVLAAKLAQLRPLLGGVALAGAEPQPARFPFWWAGLPLRIRLWGADWSCTRCAQNCALVRRFAAVLPMNLIGLGAV
jgi:hypothetical protein